MGERWGPPGSRSQFRGLAAGTVLVALLVSAQLSLTADSQRLTDSERRELDRGELIVTTREVEGYPWPEITVYRRVAASAEEVVAVYADFDGQSVYLPNLVGSRVATRVSHNSFLVSYEYEVRGPNERYTVLAAVSRSLGGLQVTWDLVTARYARRLSGHMKVQALDSGALIEYTNRVDPGFFGVRLGSPESTARQLRDTVQGLASRVERLRAEQPETLRALVDALQSMLGER